MELVKDIRDIKQNIETLEGYLQDREYKDFAISLIKKGICFVSVKSEKGYMFFPSRFIGYKANSYNAHINNHERDGRKTNPAISVIIGYKPTPSGDLEKAYRKFCDELGFTANERGTFGVERKYWELD